MTFRGLLLPLLLAAPLAPAEEPRKPVSPPPTIRPEGADEVEVNDPKLKADIEDAIRRGVAWLKGRQEGPGGWPGLDPGPVYPGGSGRPWDDKPELSALTLLALLKCGVPPADPCIVRGFDWLQKQNLTVTGGYGPAIALMALEAKHAPKEAVAVKRGDRPKPAKPKPVTLDPAESLWAGKLTTELVTRQARPGGWRYQSPPMDMEGGRPGLGDVSCTQYALMGLKCARRMGIPVKPEVFYKAADFLLDQQEADGKGAPRITRRTAAESPDAEVGGYGDKVRGFPYMKGAADKGDAVPSGGMTCAGVVGLLICRSECLEDKALKKEERTKKLARMEQGIWDGLAWLDAHWAVEENPGHGDQELGYYLYGLERVGIMADLRMIGPGHDWYLEGAKLLTSRIKPEGADKGLWQLGAARPKPETQDTPYALLFLRKASIRLGYSVGESE